MTMLISVNINVKYVFYLFNDNNIDSPEKAIYLIKIFLSFDILSSIIMTSFNCLFISSTISSEYSSYISFALAENSYLVGRLA